MKISDFIKELEEFNQDADITLISSEDIALSWVCSDSNNHLVSKKDTLQVFIEGRDYLECCHEYMNGDTRWCSLSDTECERYCKEFEEFVDP